MDDTHDFVHREVRYALQHLGGDYSLGGVIPVIVQNATMPKATELHPDIRPLAGINGFCVDPETFNEDVAALSKMIKALWPTEQKADRILDMIDADLGPSEMKFYPTPASAKNPELHDLPEVAKWQCVISNGLELRFQTRESGAFEGQLLKPRNVRIEGFYNFHFGPRKTLCMLLKGSTFDGESFEFDIPIERRAGERSYSGSNDLGDYFRLEWFSKIGRIGGRFGF